MLLSNTFHIIKSYIENIPLNLFNIRWLELGHEANNCGLESWFESEVVIDDLGCEVKVVFTFVVHQVAVVDIDCDPLIGSHEFSLHTIGVLSFVGFFIQFLVFVEEFEKGLFNDA